MRSDILEAIDIIRSCVKSNKSNNWFKQPIDINSFLDEDSKLEKFVRDHSTTLDYYKHRIVACQNHKPNAKKVKTDVNPDSTSSAEPAVEPQINEKLVAEIENTIDVQEYQVAFLSHIKRQIKIALEGNYLPFMDRANELDYLYFCEPNYKDAEYELYDYFMSI